jgi:EmrB/QacA subfamily drug resistance transporter
MTTDVSAHAARPGPVLAVTAVSALIVALDQMVVVTALQTIQADLGGTLDALQWTVNAFALPFAALMIPWAGLADRLGHRRVYLAGLVLFAVASVLCALAPTTAFLIAARVLQGVAGAAVMPTALALLVASTPPARRGATLGAYAAVTGVAVVGGPVLGGAVAAGLSWQWVFWINVPVIAVVVPLGARVLPEHRGTRSRIDLVGLVLVAVALTSVVWGLVRSGSAGWADPVTTTAVVGGLLVLAVFVAWERRVPVPMLPVHLFGVRNFAAGNLAALLQFASLFGVVFFLAQYLQVSLRHSPLEAGLRYLPWTALMLVLPPLMGRVVDRYGARWVLVGGLLVQGTGMVVGGLAVARGAGYTELAVLLLLSGIGTSAAMPAQQTAVLSALPPAATGQASATFNTVRQIGGPLGVAALGAVFAAYGGDLDPAWFASGFSAVLVAAGIVALLGAASATTLRGRAGAPHMPTEEEAIRARR